MFVQNEIQKKKNYKPAETQHTYFNKNNFYMLFFARLGG